MFDAQMLDYHPHDVDVLMNTSVNSESWTHEEAIMEDDGLHSTHKATYENVSIEVDMEDYDENATEFDMLNDAQHFYAGDGATELVDVEVYDVTQVHSPAFVSQPVPDDDDDDDDTHVSRAGHEQHQDTEEIIFPAAGNGTYLKTAELTPTHHTHLAESLAVEGHAVDSSATSQIDSNPIAEVGTEGVGLTKTDTLANLTPVPSSGNPPPASGMTDGTRFDLSGETSDEQSHEHKASSDTDDHEVAHEEPAQSTAYEDPHEISEGVYIDPPPSVLLTIDITDRFDVSLFNEATTVTGQGNKEENTTSVVLQYRPTLYYEPLSAVFEGLRQETFLSDISDVSEGELVLEAYDLQLVMPEDNCYVRGLSLHDINMLHDAHGLSGPLRLRLRLDLPRFIIRYQRLHERITQLTVENQEVETNQVVQQKAQNGTDCLEYTENEKESHDITFVDSRAQLSLPEGKENEQDDVGTKPSQEFADSNLSEPVEDSYELEYVDNAEVGSVTASGEAEVCEDRSSSGTRIRPTSGVVAVFEEEQARDKTVGETASIEGREGDVPRSTSRPPDPYLSGKVSGEAVSSLIPSEVARTEDTNTDIVDQSHDTEELTEQFIPADDSHGSTSVGEVYDHGALTEEQLDSTSVIPIVASDPETRGETWDDELYAEGEADAPWDHDTNQDEEGEADASWDHDTNQDEEGEADASWDHETNEDEEEQSASAESSVTLSSSRLSSKRSFHELEEDEDEPLSQSTEPKKVRTE
ncbi:hypothetical protein APHAL10511_001328 [Amanita phalloides]|nr:hypothetical protein APHAL10511_001328 [Amanita phalloides]